MEAEGARQRGRPPASGRDAEEPRSKTSELTQKTKNAASRRHTRGAWLPHRLPPPTHDVHAGRNVESVHAARRPTTLGYSEDRTQHREHGAAQDRHRGHPSGSGRDRASRRCRRRRHRTWRRVTVGHAEQVPKRQRNEWTRVHRSPHTEAAEGANPTSPPPRLTPKASDEASARGSHPDPSVTPSLTATHCKSPRAAPRGSTGARSGLLLPERPPDATRRAPPPGAAQKHPRAPPEGCPYGGGVVQKVVKLTQTTVQTFPMPVLPCEALTSLSCRGMGTLASTMVTPGIPKYTFMSLTGPTI